MCSRIVLVFALLPGQVLHIYLGKHAPHATYTNKLVDYGQVAHRERVFSRFQRRKVLSDKRIREALLVSKEVCMRVTHFKVLNH